MRVHLPATTRIVGGVLVGSCFIFSFASIKELRDVLPSMNIFTSRPGFSAVVPQMPLNTLMPRQGVSVSVPQNNSPTPASSPPSSSSTPQEKSTSSSTTASSTTPQPSSSTTPPPSTEQSSSSTPTNIQSTNTPASSTTPHSSVPPVTSAILTTNQGGQTITSIVVISDAASSSSTPTQSSGPASPPSNSSSGVSSSTIIGLSVAGGVAILGIIGFFVWKFTRKQRNEFNDNEEIKWPELNAHDANVPLPTHRTGGAGIDTADVRRNSVGYAPSTAANSTAELYPDPYAVPPLPHLDPNQLYHDDPNARYYDPYRGPVPQTFEGVPGESIPMTQLAGRRSPGPGAAFAGDLGGGRASPAPQGAYGGSDFGGRASPAPQYSAGRASPGPGVAYGAGGRASPAPQAGYGNYGPR